MMNKLTKITAVFAVFMLTSNAYAFSGNAIEGGADAGIESAKELTKSGASLVVSVIASPFVLISETTEALGKYSKRNDDKTKNEKTGVKQRHTANDIIPAMAVKNIAKNENDQPFVFLENPNDAKQHITITWQKNEKINPAAEFRKDTMISFKPSTQKTGWLLQDDRGQDVAFMPLPDNLSDNHSQTF